MSDHFSKVRPFEILDWRPVVKNTLRGFAVVRQPSGMVIADVGVHEREGKAWASPPSKPMLDRDGRQLRDTDGKARWSNLISFADRATQTTWSDAVVAAVRAQHPEALA